MLGSRYQPRGQACGVPGTTRQDRVPAVARPGPAVLGRSTASRILTLPLAGDARAADGPSALTRWVQPRPVSGPARPGSLPQETKWRHRAPPARKALIHSMTQGIPSRMRCPGRVALPSPASGGPDATDLHFPAWTGRQRPVLGHVQHRVRNREHGLRREPGQAYGPRLRPMFSFMILVVPPKIILTGGPPPGTASSHPLRRPCPGSPCDSAGALPASGSTVHPRLQTYRTALTWRGTSWTYSAGVPPV